MFLNIIMSIKSMKTIQMTIDESLLQQVDQTVQELKTSRSAFIRQALLQAIRQYQVRRLEERDETGYQIMPAQAGETNEWLSEQDWGSSWNEEK
jgi:metal-responsive CopG/Arc/MetJ family transcriptional regulator